MVEPIEGSEVEIMSMDETNDFDVVSKESIEKGEVMSTDVDSIKDLEVMSKDADSIEVASKDTESLEESEVEVKAKDWKSTVLEHIAIIFWLAGMFSLTHPFSINKRYFF